MIIRVKGSRLEMIRRQKQIINYVDKHQDRHGSDRLMRQVMRDYKEVCKDGGICTDTKSEFSSR